MRSATASALARMLDPEVEHLVDADEVRSDDVPVRVLEDEVEVVVGGEAFLQNVDDLLGVAL